METTQTSSAPLLLQRRNALLGNLEAAPRDILVIGGGIVGAGVARDAAMRGLQTALVERHDFASGTSSRTSRLLHGGLRYLAQGRIGLVRQASVEKRTLHRIAPHLAEPLAFIFPTYPGTDWPLWQMRIGVRIYDLLCGGKNLGKSSALSRTEVLSVIPLLKQDRLTGAVRYFDGFTNDARLVLDTLRSAAAHGALPLNYCGFQNATRHSDGWRCQIIDQLTGRPFVLQARAVVNATGPWAQAVPHSQIHLRLTRGIHIVVPRQRLPFPSAVVLTAGKRILFVIPWGQRAIVGTTDTDYSGDLDNVQPTAEDVSYLLRALNDFFPSARISNADIISSWAGLRPLIADAHGAASDISRAHQIGNPEPGWWDVAGGKLTTYRLIAEQTVDQISAEQKWQVPPCATDREPLLKPGEADGVSGILPPTLCRDVVAHYCRNEWAVHLDDVMVRRANWHQYHGDSCHEATQVADWMREHLEWSAAEKSLELTRYRQAFPKDGFTAGMGL